MSTEYINNKKRINIYDKIFKHLNNNLSNVFTSKFKSDRHKSSETKIKSLRVVYKISFKLVQSSRDLGFFVSDNYFLNVRLKDSKIDFSEIESIKKNLFLLKRKTYNARLSINHDFLDICLKYLKNDSFEIVLNN